MFILYVYIYISIFLQNSYLHAYITYNLRAMTWFKIASLHLVIPCWNDLKEKVQNDSCIRVLVAMRFPLGHSAEQKLLATSGHPEPLVPQNFYAAYMCLVSQVTSQWSKRCCFLQRQGRLGKTPRLGPRGQFSEARSFHSFNENVALHIISYYVALPETKKITWKLMVGRLLSFGEGLFSGAMFVLGRVHDMYIMFLLMSWCPVGLCAESW